MTTIGSGDFVTILADHGSYLPYRTGSVSISAGVEATTYSSTSSVLMLAQHMSESHEFVMAGRLEAGDITGYFKGDDSLLVQSKGKEFVEIQWNGDWYRQLGEAVIKKVDENPIFKTASFRKT